MTTTPPTLGLLLDIDGPIASPHTRTISRPSILTDLVALAAHGVPIAFITGRSSDFVRDEVVAPLIEAGLPEGIRMFAACEKGAVTFAITAAGIGAIDTDSSVALPTGIVNELHGLVSNGFASTMFFDETKRAMVSVEQRTDVSDDEYQSAQGNFNVAAFDLLAARGIGVRLVDREAPDANGETPFRVEPTIISTDIESVTLDKDRAAENALAFLARSGPLPRSWRSVGDSRGDYLMADFLHAAGYDVAHIDVRPADGVLDRPYPIIAIGERIHDDAGAEFLGHWVRQLGLR